MGGGKVQRPAPPFRTQLSKAQQQQLYEDAQAMLLQPDAMLVKVAEPVQPTVRDSWMPKPG